MMTSNSAKESLNIRKQQLINKSGTHHVPQEPLVMVVGKPVSNLSLTVGEPVQQNKTCCYRCRQGEGSVQSKCAFFSIAGYITYMSILACASVCSFVCLFSAFSIFSINSVASVASVNSVLSIGSINCFQCVFNVPIQSLTGLSSNTCQQYRLDDGADENRKELFYGLTYHTVEPAVETKSEADLVNDCCLFLHSTEAKQNNLKGFILNSNRTACLVYSGEHAAKTGATTYLDRTDVDTAKYVFKPCQPGQVCI